MKRFLGLLLLGLFLLVPGQGWPDEGAHKLSKQKLSHYIQWVYRRYKGAPDPPPEWVSSMAPEDLARAAGPQEGATTSALPSTEAWEGKPKGTSFWPPILSGGS